MTYQPSFVSRPYGECATSPFELSQPFKNGRVGVTHVRDIEEAGGKIVYGDAPTNPNHETVNGLTADQLQQLFMPNIKKQAKVGK